MTTIYLKHGEWVAGVADWETSADFNVLEFYSIPVTKHISGTNLSQDEYVHVLSTRNIWNLVISANELVYTSIKTFIINFYKASIWAFSMDNINWTEVTIGDGTMPIENLLNNKHLPEVKLVLIQKEPD